MSQYVPNQSISLSIPAWLPPVFVAVYLLVGLTGYGLFDNNEGLYAEIAREMSRGGSLVIPQLLGLPYMEKPPLLYYFIAISFRVLGETEFAARLVPLLSSLICLWGVNHLCVRINRAESGRLAVIIMVSSLGYMIMSRLVMFDMLFTAYLTLAVFLSYLAWTESQKRDLRIAYAFLALALLTKGFVALVIFGLTWMVHFLASERRQFWKGVRFLLDLPALGIFLVIALPWHVLAMKSHPNFTWYYFINEHLLRFLGQRMPHDYYGGPIYYYLPRLLGFLFPWTFFLLLTVGQNGPATEKDQHLTRFLWIAVLVPLVFFSLSSAKANYYLVVTTPALAILIALSVQILVEGGHGRLIALPLTVFLLVALAAGGFIVFAQGLPGLANLPEAPTWMSMAAISIALVIGALLLAMLEKPVAALLGFALLLGPIQFGLSNELDRRENTISSRYLAYAIKERCPACQVLIYKDYESISSLAFYLPRFPGIIDSESNELWFAKRINPKSPIFVSAAELAVHMEDQKFIVVVPEARFNDFNGSAMGGRMEPAGVIGKVRLFVN